jgi:hypothetical protein
MPVVDALLLEVSDEVVETALSRPDREAYAVGRQAHLQIPPAQAGP